MAIGIIFILLLVSAGAVCWVGGMDYARASMRARPGKVWLPQDARSMADFIEEFAKTNGAYYTGHLIWELRGVADTWEHVEGDDYV